MITELTFLANELLCRDFINIKRKYNYPRTNNFKIFLSFVAHDFPVINYYFYEIMVNLKFKIVI